MFERTAVRIIDKDHDRAIRIRAGLELIDIQVLWDPSGESFELRDPAGLILLHDGDQLRSFRRLLQCNIATIPSQFILYEDSPLLENVVEAVSLGAADYWRWPFKWQTLANRFEEALVKFEHDAAIAKNAKMAEDKVGRLTPREHDVLIHLSRGLSNRGIGGQLGISARTVEIHRRNLIRKLGVGSSIEAVTIALRAGL